MAAHRRHHQHKQQIMTMLEFTWNVLIDLCLVGAVIMTGTVVVGFCVGVLQSIANDIRSQKKLAAERVAENPTCKRDQGQAVRFKVVWPD